MFLAAPAGVGGAGDLGVLAHLGLKAVWADELSVEDPQTLIALATQAGVDGAARLVAGQGPAHAQKAEAPTKETVERDLFGAPSYFYQGEPF